MLAANQKLKKKRKQKHIYIYIYISNCLRQTRHRALTPDTAEKKYLTCLFRLGVFMYIYRYIWQGNHTCTHGSCPRALPHFSYEFIILLIRFLRFSNGFPGFLFSYIFRTVYCHGLPHATLHCPGVPSPTMEYPLLPRITLSYHGGYIYIYDIYIYILCIYICIYPPW